MLAAGATAGSLTAPGAGADVGFSAWLSLSSSSGSTRCCELGEARSGDPAGERTRALGRYGICSAAAIAAASAYGLLNSPCIDIPGAMLGKIVRELACNQGSLLIQGSFWPRDPIMKMEKFCLGGSRSNSSVSIQGGWTEVTFAVVLG